MSFMGVTPSGPFIVGEIIAKDWFQAPNAHGKPNSDILRPWFNGSDITGRSSNSWVIDFSQFPTEQEAALYELPFAFVRKEVQEARKGYKTGGKSFWKFERARPEMRSALASHPRYLARSMVGKHQFYVWFSACILPANLVIVFANSSDCFFGFLQSRFHEVWSLKQGTRLETRPRYTPTTCFETFPFPLPTPAQEAVIAAAAKELNELRERWLNPPEWTRTEYLEFPASVDGPWSRYVDCGGNPANAGATPLSPAPARQSAVAATLCRRSPKSAKPAILALNRATPIAPRNSKSACSRNFTTSVPRGSISPTKNWMPPSPPPTASPPI
jgi:hypothetical protein